MGSHSALIVSHLDEIRPGAISSGWHKVQLTLCHPDDLRKLCMSSGWHNTLTISQPDEILPIAKSSGRLREQLSFICHPYDLLQRQWVYWLMYMILGLAGTLDRHITGPLWGNPPAMRLFETDIALSIDWKRCWSISQGAGEFRRCGTPVTSL